MNYQGIVNWLQEDGFVLMGFSERGEITLMAKHTGEEVNNLPSFLTATVLPIAKMKVTHELIKGGASSVEFVECIYPMGEIINGKWDRSVLPEDTERVMYQTDIRATGNRVADGSSKVSFEQATINAIEGYIIKQNQEKINDKG